MIKAIDMPTYPEKNPVRGGCLTGLIGGGNEGKEETSFLLGINSATIMPFKPTKAAGIEFFAPAKSLIIKKVIFTTSYSFFLFAF
jgi:hypothetical protein